VWYKNALSNQKERKKNASENICGVASAGISGDTAPSAGVYISFRRCADPSSSGTPSPWRTLVRHFFE
jgi:hypothetical protein